jgi:hypothetical protein
MSYNRDCVAELSSSRIIQYTGDGATGIECEKHILSFSHVQRYVWEEFGGLSTVVRRDGVVIVKESAACPGVIGRSFRGYQLSRPDIFNHRVMKM